MVATIIRQGIKRTSMLVSPADIASDIPLAAVLFGFILSIVFITKKIPDVWINRKLIHLSSSPAVLVYMYVFREPYIFFSFAIAFTLALFIPHLRSRELNWFQVKRNFGEVLYTLSFAVLSISLWEANKVLAGTAMLFMSVGDSVTGMIRSRFVTDRSKHWTGTLGMLITCILIGVTMLGEKGIVLSIVATLAEYQPWIDDNVTVPFMTTLTSLVLI